MFDPQSFTPQMAMDPSLPPQLQAQLAQTRPDLLPFLAQNPALFPELRQWISGHPDPRVRAALAGSPARPSYAANIPGAANQPPKTSAGLIISIIVTVVIILAVGGFFIWKAIAPNDPAPSSGTQQVQPNQDGQDDQNGSALGCEGIWKLTGVEGVGEITSQEDIEMMEELGLSVSLEMKAGGNAEFGLFEESMSGTWKAKDQGCEVTIEGLPILGNLDGDTFTLDQEGSKMIFTRSNG